MENNNQPNTNISPIKPEAQHGSKVKGHSLATMLFYPASIKFQNQNENERILLFIRQHKIVLIPPIFWSLVLVFIPPIIVWLIKIGDSYNFHFSFGLTPGIWIALTILWYFFIFAYLFQVFLNWYFNVYVMTNQRLIDFDFNGLLSHGADETNLTNIETAESGIGGLWGTVFNMGTITVRTAADQNNFVLDNIPDPSRIRDFVMDFVVSLDEKNKP